MVAPLEILGFVRGLVYHIDIWQSTQETSSLSLDAKALKAQQGNERWNGVFQDQHVGFTVNRTSALKMVECF